MHRGTVSLLSVLLNCQLPRTLVGVITIGGASGDIERVEY